MSDERQVWERMEGESTKAYSAFVHYRDLAPESRSYLGAYKKYIGPEKAAKVTSCGSYFKRWADRFRWRERVEAFDDNRHSEELAATSKIREEILITGYTGLRDLLKKQIEKAMDNNAEFSEITRLINTIRDTLKMFQATDMSLSFSVDGEESALVIVRHPNAYGDDDED